MKSLVIANWKCNPTTQKEAKRIFDSVRRGVKNTKAEIVICPPFLFLPLLNGLTLAGQNVFYEEKGAFTGEVSAMMLKDFCEYVIVGHSERRRYFSETDETVNKKLKLVLETGLKPILCIGETQKERNQGETEEVLKKQIISDLDGISGARFSKGVIAYEPVWAIGTGNPCDFDEAQKMGLLIRKIISNIYGVNFSKKIRLLYGGSVNSKNAGGYIKEAGFNGLLVGGASLNAEEFVKIIKESV